MSSSLCAESGGENGGRRGLHRHPQVRRDSQAGGRGPRFFHHSPLKEILLKQNYLVDFGLKVNLTPLR